jgi:hypothetical protein
MWGLWNLERRRDHRLQAIPHRIGGSQARRTGGNKPMINLTTEKRITNIALWFFVVCVGLILLTSCSPVMDLNTTATPSPTATAQISLRYEISPTPAPACTVTAYTLNLRNGAGMSHAVIQILHKGQAVTVIERGAWLRVSTGKATGFIYGKYCQE